MSSSNARASASVLVDEAGGEEDAGSRLHADISGEVAVPASATVAWRRVSKESDNGTPTWWKSRGDAAPGTYSSRLLYGIQPAEPWSTRGRRLARSTSPR